ncbi:MAG: VWA domain-containing protein [Acidobacteriota bacterium]
MKKISYLWVSVVFILSHILFCPFFSNTQEKERGIKPTHEVIVELVLVEVIVTDKHGNFIKDLTEREFEIYEDGKLVPTKYFNLISLKEEIPLKLKPEELKKETTPPTLSEKKQLIVTFDTINTFYVSLEREKKKIFEILETLLNNNVEISIAEINEKDGIKILLPFILDKILIKESIENIKGNPWILSESPSFRKLYNPGWEVSSLKKEIENISYAYFQKRRIEKTLSSLLALINFIKKNPGKKNILLISQGIPEIKKEEILKIFDPFDILPKKNLKDYYRIIDEVIHLSNAENITFYTFSLDETLRSLLSDMDVTIGGETAGIGEKVKPIDEKIDDIRKLQSILSNFSLAHLADETGGILFRGDKYDKFSEEISRDLSSYYEIGYKPIRKREDGKYHRIEVKVKRPGLIVRSRKGYADYREEDKIKRNLASAFLSPEYFKDIKFFSEVDAISLGSGRYSVICRMSILTEQFEKLSSEELTFLLAVKEKDEEKVHMSQTRIKIKGKVKDELQYLFGMKSMKLKPGEYEVKVVLTNKEGKIGAWEKIIKIPDLKKDSSLKIINSIPGYLKKSEIKKGRPFTLNEDASICLSRYQFYPLMGDKIRKDEKIALFLQIHNPGGENISLEFSLKGEKIKGNLIEREWREKEKIMNEVYILDFKGIPPGEYRIYLNIIDKNEKAISHFIKIKIKE